MKINLFHAQEAASKFVADLCEGTTMASAIFHVAVDVQMRCIPVSDDDDGYFRDLILEQSACIVQVSYHYGRAVIMEVEYINPNNE